MKAYNELMDEIKVTDEMRRRILQKCAQEEPERGRKHCTWSRLLPVAACLVVVLGGFALFNRNQAAYQPEQGIMAVLNMEECGSAEALEQRAGFPIQVLGDIPFEVTTVSYSWCWDELAQIRYQGADDSLLYRKARGTEDISGDYNIYDDVEELAVSGVAVTLKGSNGLFYLAIWQRDGYTCTLSSAAGMEQSTFIRLLQANLPG